MNYATPRAFREWHADVAAVCDAIREQSNRPNAGGQRNLHRKRAIAELDETRRLVVDGRWSKAFVHGAAASEHAQALGITRVAGLVNRLQRLANAFLVGPPQVMPNGFLVLHLRPGYRVGGAPCSDEIHRVGVLPTHVMSEVPDDGNWPLQLERLVPCNCPRCRSLLAGEGDA